jgi:hypothetical protein
MDYRHLTGEEISTLLSYGCYAANWGDITVNEDFTPSCIRNTRFEGGIKLGIYSGTIDVDQNNSKQCGIFNCNISNCEIGNRIHISDVRDLSGYIIEDDVVITNAGSIKTDGETSFGNGTVIEILNEGGGRELPVFDRLTAQIAYLAAFYRHDKEFTARMLDIISVSCESARSRKGLIRSGARISDSLVIHNVNIGSCAVIAGASLLEEGTIVSRREAPVKVGTGVMAKKFIILSGSEVDGAAILEKTFVGQGVKIGRQFSAENSAFFANSEAFHGEACSLFAGPYSVTHHKSTLLIASYTSFFNAGSGTNQSNHMYKLGPLHQGILERGSKTGSFSYLLLPVNIGPFSVVMGKHYTNFDTSDFPFSYISEGKGRSELTPAMNLFTVGTRRDIDKWPVRDRRSDPHKLDLIHFDLLNPYITGKIIRGINVLAELSERAVTKQEYLNYKGIYIHRLLLKTTRKYYEIALKIYIGSTIARRLAGLDDKTTITTVKELLMSRGQDGTGSWLDICGMLSPSSKISELVEAVKAGIVNSVDDLEANLFSIYSGYPEYSWQWCADLIRKQSGYNLEDLPVDSLIQIISDWQTNAVKLNSMILKDAEKEFDPGSRIGYGIDGESSIRDDDFIAVRGEYDKNRFVTTLRKESAEIEERAGRLISLLEILK